MAKPQTKSLAKGPPVYPQQMMSAMHRSSPVLVWVVDEAGVISFCEGGAMANLGITQQDMQGQQAQVFFAEAPELLEKMKLAHQQSAPLLFPLHYKGRMVQVGLYPMSPEETNQKDLAGIFIDITQQHRMVQDLAETKAKLEESERRLNTIFQHVNLAIALVDTQGRYTLFNHHWPEMLGYTPQEMHQLHISDITYAEDIPQTLELMQKTLAGKIPGYQIEKRYRRKDGSVFWGELNSTPIRDAQGKIVEFVGVIQDINDRKGAQDALLAAKEHAEAATRIKDKFVSLVAHDLRAPLSAVTGLLGLMLMDATLSQQNQDELHSIIKRLHGLQEMISDVLSISRLQTGSMEVRKITVSLVEMLEPLLQLKPLAEQKGITLKNLLPPSKHILVDPALFKQVIQNLLSNAIKFSHAGGTITLSLSPDNPNALVIQDNGVGIAQEMLPHLFHHEVRESHPGTAGELGSGFGLPLVYDIMVAHGGKISVNSQPGVGTTFVLELPPSQPLVLLVDNNPQDERLLSPPLNRLGAKVIMANDGREAWELLLEMQPSLVVLDMPLPDMDSLELLKQMKQHPELHYVPVVMLTSVEDQTNRERALGLGAAECIAKPLHTEDWVPRIRELLG